ncbi:protein translocase subunit SecF [Nitriliruptoraceae bacterium ZYF776]|nr:protein translocase subunit SecF [Profundirhabdus halotolerans]
MRTPRFDFVGLTKRWAILSGVLLIVSLATLLVRGLDLSIEFEGGTAYRVSGMTQQVESGDLRDAVEATGVGDVFAQLQGDGSNALIRTEATEPGSEEAQAIEAALTDLTQPEEITVSFVGPSWGERVTRQAGIALIVFLAVIVLYISMRLEFKMAIASVVALVHDVLITIGIYALVGFSVSPATVIALLTILGYSLYDSVVIFDRVKENERYLGEPGFRSYGQLVNTSMNEVLWRSVNTSITSLLPVGALLLLGSQVLGATTLQDLSLALFVGMAIGVYSSLFVAGPLLAWWKLREPEEVKRAEKAAKQLGKGRARLGSFEAPVPEADPTTALSVSTAVLDEIEAGDHEAEAAEDDDATDEPQGPVSRAPVTTEYVRGKGKQGRSRRRR